MDRERTARDSWAAEADPTLLGPVLAGFRAKYAWNRHALARWLGITFEQLGALAHEPSRDLPLPSSACLELAERYSADASRLATILGQEPRRWGRNR